MIVVNWRVVERIADSVEFHDKWAVLQEDMRGILEVARLEEKDGGGKDLFYAKVAKLRASLDDLNFVVR